MIKPFLDALRRLTKKDKDSPGSEQRRPDTVEPEDSFLAALPVVARIVRRRFAASSNGIDPADLEQSIILRLLEWKGKNQHKSEQMTASDWEAFAARAAVNESNRQFKKIKGQPLQLSLDDCPALASPEILLGNTNAEFQSLAGLVWQEICGLTLRERRAFLLKNCETVIYLLKSGRTDKQLAEELKIDLSEWLEIKEGIPLPDERIARLVVRESKKSKDLKSMVGSLKTARSVARDKIRPSTDK